MRVLTQFLGAVAFAVLLVLPKAVIAEFPITIEVDSMVRSQAGLGPGIFTDKVVGTEASTLRSTLAEHLVQRMCRLGPTFQPIHNQKKEIQ